MSRMADRYIRYDDAIKVIDRDRCKDLSCKDCDINTLCRTIREKRELKKLVVEATPVQHGHWDSTHDGHRWVLVCSECGAWDYDEEGYKPHFCHSCGAKMDNDGGGKRIK